MTRIRITATALILLAISVTCLGADMLTNSSQQVATELRVLFDQPVELIAYGDDLMVVKPDGPAEEFLFSGGEVVYGGLHWLNWAPREASLISHEWIYGAPLQVWHLGLGVPEENDTASTRYLAAETVRFRDDGSLVLIVDEAVPPRCGPWSFHSELEDCETYFDQYTAIWSQDTEEVVVGDPILPAMYFRSTGGFLASGAAMTGRLGPFGEFAVTSFCGPREIVNLRTGEIWPIAAQQSDSMYCARFAFSHTGETLAVVHGSLFRVWATHTGKLLLEMELPALRSSEYYDGLTFSLDDERVVLSLRNRSPGKAVVIDPQTRSYQELIVSGTFEWFPRSVGLAGSSLLNAYSSDTAYRVDILDLATGSRVSRLASPKPGSPKPYDLLVLPGESGVLVAGERTDEDSVETFVHLWDLDRGRLLWQSESDGAYLPGSLVVSHDGHYAAIVHVNGEVVIWGLPDSP